jgi:hypothetical protein
LVHRAGQSTYIDEGPEKRFTLAHEYGHHFLGHGPQWHRSIDPAENRVKIELRYGDEDSDAPG